MSTFVNTDTGQVLGIVDGRNSTGIQGWLDARTPAWRDRIEVVAIDPSATFRSALETALPAARISVDHWHLVRLANLMVTKVRQRVAQETKGHRGRKDNLAWARRMLLLRAGDRLSERAVHRLDHVFAHDDPTGEIGPPGASRNASGCCSRAPTSTPRTPPAASSESRCLPPTCPRPGGCGRPSTTGGTRSRPSSRPESRTPGPRPRTPASSTSSAPDGATATPTTTSAVSCYTATGRHAGGAHA